MFKRSSPFVVAAGSLLLEITRAWGCPEIALNGSTAVSCSFLWRRDMRRQFTKDIHANKAPEPLAPWQLEPSLSDDGSQCSMSNWDKGAILIPQEHSQ